MQGMQSAYCIPSDEISPEQHLVRRRMLIQAGLQKAIRNRVIGEEGEASFRDALPSDLGMTSLEWRTPPLQADTFTIFISYELRATQVLVMYGIAQEDANPAVTIMRVSVAQKAYTYGLIALQRLYAHLVLEKGKCRKEAMLAEPILFAPPQNVIIEVGSRKDKPEGDLLIPLFLTLDPKGVFLSCPDSKQMVTPRGFGP